jgi:DNA-binding LacI/PurR family transcriptional regulator
VDGGAAAVSKLMSLPEPPTAIFFTDPGSTVGALRRAQELGIRVPDELSIIGVDDEQMRRWTHPVYTAIVQQAPEIGFQAGRWLARVVASGKSKSTSVEPLRMDLQAFLEINGTTGAVPRRAVRVAPNGHRIGADQNHGHTETPNV